MKLIIRDVKGNVTQMVDSSGKIYEPDKHLAELCNFLNIK
jgi:hypothetical protein